MAQIVKNLSAVRGTGFNPWVGKIPGKGNGYPFQYSCLENSMDRGAELDMTELQFHFLFGFGIRLMVALWNEFGTVLSSAIFGNSFRRIGVNFSLNVS